MTIDLEVENGNHLRLKEDLHSFLYKKAELKPCYHYDCTLGQWLYTRGIVLYKNVAEVHALERIHTEIHNKISDCVKYRQEGKSDYPYEDTYKSVEDLSEQLGVLLKQVKEKIGEQMKKGEDIIYLANKGETLNKKMQERNADLMQEHQTLSDFFMQAPGLFCVLKGPQHTFQLVNPYYKQIIGDRELKGKDIRSAMPELEGQGVFELLDKVYLRQRSFSGKEIPIFFDKGKGIQEKAFVNFIYKPIINRKKETTGILVFGYDVSEQVNLRKQSEESEARLKLAMDAAEMGSFEWNMNTRDFVYSERLSKIYGYSKKAKITHKDFVDAIHPDDKKIRIHAIEESLRTGVLFYEARIVRPDKHIRWIKFSGRIIFDRNRNPQRMYGTALDVTEQKMIAEHLEKKVKERTKELMIKNDLLNRQKELSESVINSSIDNIAVFDTKLNYVIMNEHGLQAYKKKPEKIIGKRVDKAFPQLAKSEFLRDLKRALKGETIHNFNYRSPILKGYFEVSMIPLKDNEGKVFGVLTVAHDNGYIVEASERLIAANKKLEEKNLVLEKNNRELESFRYIANHDLQEPLRKIQMFTGLIKKNIKDETLVKEYIDNVSKASRSMSDIIRAVLNFSVLSRNDERFKEIDLNTVLEDVTAELQPVIDMKKATINCANLLPVEGSYRQLKQLFSCILSNSLKFADKKPTVTISSKIILTKGVDLHTHSKVNKYVELIFKDNGIGFEQKYAEQIFKMFKRLQTSHLYPGAGIGLAIVKKVVDNHQGHIFVKSEPGKGTAFYIYFPVL
ncbi:MAG: arcB [Bacteroidota bacterium]|jgi:PAS domain S-box-containing protein|nr:arcB [Bacteroidota bacterium]